jgi:hypothetical protein
MRALKKHKNKKADMECLKTLKDFKQKQTQISFCIFLYFSIIPNL